MMLHLSPGDWLDLLLHYLSLSLLAVGGAITLIPDMHRYLVDQQGWLSDTQFNASVAIAQAAPGPNTLFIGLMGWNVGLNAAGGSGSGHAVLLGLLGMGLSMTGMLLPSSLLTWLATRWAYRNRDRRAVRAFKLGMAPLVIGLLAATAWTLASAHASPGTDWPLWLLTVVSGVLVWRTRIHLLWLLGAGALMGMLGLF